MSQTERTTPEPVTRRSWELIAVVAVLAVYVLVNLGIIVARPAIMKSAVASVDSVLARDRRLLDQDLMRWRSRMLEDGQWVAGVVDVVLDAEPVRSRDTLSEAAERRVAALTRLQLPAARVWVFSSDGKSIGGIGTDAPTPRHQWLARSSLRRDTVVLAATEARGSDLRLSVASPVVNARYGRIAVVLDLPAAERLTRTVAQIGHEGRSGQAAVTFPYDAGFVGVKFKGDGNEPEVTWPKTGWSLTDSSLIVVGGSLADTTPRFELGIPRAAAYARGETRIAWMHAAAALVALPLCVIVLLIGRSARNARLASTERSLAASSLRAAHAETAATRAGLAAISARLNPHFLSNAMHSVSALIAADPMAAEDALERIGDLFRYSLEHSERHSVRLEDEWLFVRDYLAIEQMRLGTRLRVEMVLDPEAADCDVPAFVLQPLVENAVRHGISPRPAGGMVRVSAHRVDDRVELTVEDDGQGADPAHVQSSHGTGLKTLTQRLTLDARFAGAVDVQTAVQGGFQVRVTLKAQPSCSGAVNA